MEEITLVLVTAGKISSFLQICLSNRVRRNDGSLLLSFSVSSCNLHIVDLSVVDKY